MYKSIAIIKTFLLYRNIRCKLSKLNFADKKTETKKWYNQSKDIKNMSYMALTPLKSK